AVLREEADSTEPIDMLVTNYVYDKVGKRNKHVVNFRHAMRAGERLTWNESTCSSLIMCMTRLANATSMW
ncbi:hypothetical protein KHP57_21585, partial [Algiphilus sp. NNCM1]|nr:hypothetical protein [Algiphilus acroporae]